MSEITLSRRDFLNLGLTGLGAALAASCTKGAVERFGDYTLSLDYLEGVKPSPHPLPKQLQGLTINSPFLYNRGPEYIDYVKDRAGKMGAGSIRIFMGNLAEKSIGKYNRRVI